MKCTVPHHTVPYHTELNRTVREPFDVLANSVEDVLQWVGRRADGHPCDDDNSNEKQRRQRKKGAAGAAA